MVAGLLYLTGIAILLLIKPTYMFREDGQWKEFGIGRDPTKFTHIPFWLFVILWSLLSYVIVMFAEDALYMPSDRIEFNRSSANVRNQRQANAVEELLPGYYMLNEGATGRNGVPRYVYLGPEGPLTT